MSGDQQSATTDMMAKELERARLGSERAIVELVRYALPRVYRNIRRHLARELRQTLDSDDVAQSVWKTLWTDREKLLAAQTPAQLRAILARIASNKTIDRGRRFFAKRRAGGFTAAPVSVERADGPPLHGSCPTPSEELIARETLQRAMECIPERYVEVLRMRMGGCTADDIAKELGLSLRTVYRVLEQVRKRTTG